MKLPGSIMKRFTPVVLIVALALTGATGATSAQAASLTNVSLTQAKPQPGASNNNYSFVVSNQSGTPLRCITIQFNTVADGSGSVPTGFDASATTFSGSFMSSWTGWATANSAGTAKVTNASAVVPSGSASVELKLSSITNGTTPDTSTFALVRTYSNQACTATVDFSTVNFVWTGETVASATIDPTLTFTVDPMNSGSCNGATITGVGSTPTAVSLGTVDKTSRAIGGQRLSVATNAGGGASVYAHVDGPLSDGHGHSIASMNASSAAPTAFTNPGTEAFGYTVDSPLSGDPTRFSDGGTKWAGIDTSDREVVYSPYSAAPISGCIAYQITISGQTVGGFYADSVTYTAVPSF